MPGYVLFELQQILSLAFYDLSNRYTRNTRDNLCNIVAVHDKLFACFGGFVQLIELLLNL
jgi:hypothetical protein